ncbi:folate-binding protein YgfZ [Salinisphaera sp. Q1T1-3]|uniref:CAF17-like 4Fe-4S cluster assembly/insertion protein YgfZ n=1 Tax=Salinisphaera sp. Q1T1-3 TaxID=2321229 RepID=UPI000E766637|nr:folate-binding protein YgfZ [Salinisphaera sp. Q1T1-3]RJS92064.1 folate-binding protein [Salinisphaera sp. Q1T1-3]
MASTPAHAPGELGILHIAGPDAAEFLRAQLTNDVLRLGPDRNFLAAWCDAKGRAQLIARVIALAQDSFLLVVPSALIEAALPRLRMFVLRSDVRVTDASAQYAIAGALDDPEAPECNATIVRDGRLLVGLPPTLGPVTRTLILDENSPLDEPDLIAITSDRWQRAMIDAGVPQVTPATKDAFVPQMLNLHWLMAIDFDKGCYPGQEVIARLHYRGRLVRHVFRLSFDGACPAIGSRLSTAAGETAGTVLQASPAAENDASGVMLAVVGVDHAHTSLQTEHGGTTAIAELPYATPT